MVRTTNPTGATSMQTTVGSGDPGLADLTIKATGNFTLDSDYDTKVLTINKDIAGGTVDAGTFKGLHVDYDHTVPNTGTATQTDIGIDLDVNAATLGTSTSYGMDIDVVGTTAGTHTLVGIAVDVSGSNDSMYTALFNGGNVGIGVSDPQDTLEVNGTILVKDKLKFTQDDGMNI